MLSYTTLPRLLNATAGGKHIINHACQRAALLNCILEIQGSRIGRDTNYPETFVVRLRPSTKMPGYHLKLAQDNFIPYHFQFVTQYRPIIPQYSLSY